MNFISQIERSVAEVLDVASSYLPNERCDELLAEFEVKKQEEAINVMLFGSYNAGKSSLINALTGDGSAVVGEIPTTASVHNYHWNDCLLLDTPGVNAPIEHEEVTEEQIRKSQLILFVIRAGDQDVHDVYERMFSMLKGGKHIFVVLNHSHEDDELQQLLEKLHQIMLGYGEQYEVDAKLLAAINVIPVNLKSAIKARKEGKKLLEERSGIHDLDYAFDSWVRKHNTETGFIERLKHYVDEVIFKPCIDAAIAKQGSHPEGDLQNLQYSRDDIARKFSLIDAKMANAVNARINLEKESIAGILASGDLKSGMEAQIQALCNNISNQLAEEFKDEVQLTIGELSISVGNISINSESGDSALGRAVEGIVLDGLKRVDQDLIKQGLLKLREWKIPKIKGRWEKTLGQWAGKATTAIQLALGAYEVYQATEEESKQNRQAQSAALDFNQAVDSVANNIRTSLIESFKVLISETKASALAPIEAEIKKLCETMGKISVDLEVLNSKRVSVKSIVI